MKNILVPIGISSNGESSLGYAIEFARIFDANVFVMDSFQSSFSNTSLINVKEVLDQNNFKRVKKLVKKIDHKGLSIKMVHYEGDFISAIDSLDKEVGIDLIITGPSPNASNELIFLGPSTGRLVKRTDIPVWIVPEGMKFSSPKKALFAFKEGQINGDKSLAPLYALKSSFETETEVLLVKVPGKKRKDFQIDYEIVELAKQTKSTNNATVYQGVLEYFREVNPDVLVVFARQRGFFEKLIESDIVYKRDFYTTIPLLVLKNRD